MEDLFQRFALGLLPLFVAVASLFALLGLEKTYPAVSGTPVALDILPVSAAGDIRHTGAQAWLAIDIPAQRTTALHVLEIPSRHISGMLCWAADSMHLLGMVSRNLPTHIGRMARLGLTVEVGALPAARTVLCHGAFVQDSDVTASLWTLPDFQQATSAFDHDMGLLEGGLLAPALLVFIIAVITRESSYALLAVWLLANLRLGAFAIGWDAQWLGHILPIDIMPKVRQFTAASYHLLTVALLLRLLQVNRFRGSPRLRQAGMGLSIVLVAASLQLPGQWFWPLTAMITAVSLLSGLALLSRLRTRTHTRLLSWFWQMVSLMLAYGILLSLALLLWLTNLDTLDSAFTTPLLLGSSTAMVLAVAERLRNARDEHERRLASLDPVTGSLNHQSMEKTVAQALRRAQRGYPACLARLNLRRFQGINHLLGYAMGDAVLAQISQQITAHLSLPHHLARLEGDEFAILFPGRTADEVTPAIHALVRHLNSHHFVMGNYPVSITLNLGVIALGPDSSNAAEALFTARRACRDARDKGQEVIIYGHGHPALREHHQLLRLLEQVRAGSAPGRLQLALQPIVSLHSPAHWGFEALLRAFNAQGEALPTGRLIAAAEDIGMIVALDMWMCDTLVRWLGENKARLGPGQFVSLNVSRISLNSEEFSRHLFERLNRHPALAPRLVLEIIESTALDSMTRSQRTLDGLRALGVRIALDDFGAGYTSFAHLRTLGAHLLKIDGSLIRHLHTDSGSAAIVHSIAQLATHLGMQSVAEWVEDQPTLQALRRMGVDYVQGFAVSSALSPEEALDAAFSV